MLQVFTSLTPKSFMRVAVLMTCHNRVDMTMECLRRLLKASECCANVAFHIFLVDDGSTDGTSEKVRTHFPNVSVIQGTGDLYWAAGMRLAWETAIKQGAWDAFLWLNDDALLTEESLLRLCEKMSTGNIVVGNITDSSGNQIYGLNPNGLFNGNCVLVSHGAYECLGMICGDYHHAWADSDYAQRAMKAQIEVVSVDSVGMSEWHPLRPTLTNKTLKERWNLLFEPKGWNLHDLWLYRKRNWNVFFAFVSCLHFICHVLFYTALRNQCRDENCICMD